MDHSDGVRELCSQEAPILEHLELKLVGHSLPTNGPALFKGQAPMLRTFSLSQVRIHWSHIPRGQLTQLKIADTPPIGNFNELIDLLVNCPRDSRT